MPNNELNPADAVRQAPRWFWIDGYMTKAIPPGASDVDAYVEFSDHAAIVAALTARVAASEKRAEHWRELYRIERAMRLMDNGLSSLDACYAAADKEIAAQDAAMQEPQP